jgi:ABC-type sulfate transport system permease component
VFAVFRNIVEICVSLIFGAMAERDVRYALVAGALCCALSALLLLCVQHMDCKYDICCK